MPSTTHAVGTTAAEAEVLAATQAAIEAGGDPFGDNDDGSEAGDGNSAAAALNSGGEDSTDEELTAEQLAAIAEEGEQPGGGTEDEDGNGTPQAGAEHAAEAEAEPKRYRVDTPEALAAAKKELRDKKAKAFKDYSDGVIDAEEFSRIDDEVADALENLTVQRTLHTANVQTEAEKQNDVLGKIIATAKEAGEIDYTDPAAAKQFDAAMTMIAADGKRRSYEQLAQAAHSAVLAARGIAPKTTAKGDSEQGQEEPAKPRENGKGPLTLRQIPAASVPNNGGSWQDQLAGLTGQAYEEAFAALTPAQKAALLN